MPPEVTTHARDVPNNVFELAVAGALRGMNHRD